MVEPGVEREAEPSERLEAGAEFGVGHQAARRTVGWVEDRGIGIPCRDVADAAEAAAAGALVCGEHRLDAVAEGQVRMADDAGRDPDGAVGAARAHGRDAVDELGLADRLHLLGPACAMHRARLHVDGRQDVVAGVGVGEEIVEQIAPVGPIPQMVVRVDDRQLRLEDRLAPALEPVLAAPEGSCGSGREVTRPA